MFSSHLISLILSEAPTSSRWSLSVLDHFSWYCTSRMLFIQDVHHRWKYYINQGVINRDTGWSAILAALQEHRVTVLSSGLCVDLQVFSSFWKRLQDRDLSSNCTLYQYLRPTSFHNSCSISSGPQPNLSFYQILIVPVDIECGEKRGTLRSK